MKGKIIINPKKNLRKPTVKTLISFWANFRNTDINTAQKDATVANNTALILLFIYKYYIKGNSQILPVWIFLLLLSIKLISNFWSLLKYGFLIIAIPITFLKVGE